MLKERLTDTEIVTEWLSKNRIEVVLWDFDGTSIKTDKLFIDAMDEYVGLLSKTITHITPEKLKSDLEEIDHETYRTFAATSKRWVNFIETATQRFGAEFSQVLSEGLPIFMNIYKTIPEPIPGAIETMETFRSAGKNMALVTHAEEDWSNLKIDGLKVRHLFDYINIVDATKPKGPEAWQAALDHFGIQAGNALVIGDSLSGDINASHRIGVKHKIYVPSIWIVNRTGDIPEGTMIVESIAHIVERFSKEI